MTQYPPVVIAQGLPLESVGLDDVVMIDEQGNRARLTSIIVYPGFTLVGAVLHQAGPKATVYYDGRTCPYQLELRLH